MSIIYSQNFDTAYTPPDVQYRLIDVDMIPVPVGATHSDVANWAYAMAYASLPVLEVLHLREQYLFAGGDVYAFMYPVQLPNTEEDEAIVLDFSTDMSDSRFQLGGPVLSGWFPKRLHLRSKNTEGSVRPEKRFFLVAMPR